MPEIQHFLPPQPGHPAGVSDWPACRSLSIAHSGLPFPSVQGAEMFWSPLRTAALRMGPALHHIPLWGHREEEAPEAGSSPFQRHWVLPHSQPAAWGYPGICCMASRRAQLAGDRSPSLRLQCKSKLCKPQLPAHVASCPSSHPHPHSCTATAGRRGQRTHHSAALQKPWSRAFAPPSCTCSGFHSWRYSWLNKMLSLSRESL